MESGGAEYKRMKEEVEKANQKVIDLEKSITRMKTNLANTESYLLKYDKEIEKED